MDIRSLRQLAWENMLAKGSGAIGVPMKSWLLNGEVAEASGAWRKGRPDAAGKLAGSAIFLPGLAEMTGADLQEAVVAKLARNQARAWRRLPGGVMVKAATAASPG